MPPAYADVMSGMKTKQVFPLRLYIQATPDSIMMGLHQ